MGGKQDLFSSTEIYNQSQKRLRKEDGSKREALPKGYF